jgi:regulator of RNase E activity RraA
MARRLSHDELLQLKRWNTPTIYNGWEQITRHDRTKGCMNLEETRDFMPQMRPMIGYAVTVVIEPSNPDHVRNRPDAWRAYREYIARRPGPKIVVVQDLDRPHTIGSFWGEVNANVHRALGCVGTITDGAVRDIDEMCNAGFKAIAKRLCVGHAYATPVEWGCEVDVFGCRVREDALIHADKHGFLVIPEEDQKGLYEAACFMDANECRTIIGAARASSGKTHDQILQELNQAVEEFTRNAAEKYGRKGEL